MPSEKPRTEYLRGLGEPDHVEHLVRAPVRQPGGGAEDAEVVAG